MFQRIQRGWDQLTATKESSTATKIIYQIYDQQKIENKASEIKKHPSHDHFVVLLETAISKTINYDIYVKSSDHEKDDLRKTISTHLYDTTKPNIFSSAIFKNFDLLAEQILIATKNFQPSKLIKKQMEFGRAVSEELKFVGGEERLKRNCEATMTAIFHRIVDLKFFFNLSQTDRQTFLTNMGKFVEEKLGKRTFSPHLFIDAEFESLKNNIISFVRSYNKNLLIEILRNDKLFMQQECKDDLSLNAEKNKAQSSQFSLR